MKNVVNLFANIGVGKAYLEDIGFKTIVANEIDPERVAIYEHIYPDVEVVCGDITLESIQKDILDKIKNRDVELVIATPPCQGFSTLNSKCKDDERNHLIYHAISLIKDINPKYVMIENVQRSLSHVIEGKVLIEWIRDSLSNYDVKAHIMDSADYGTPQHRRRSIILCGKKSEPKWKLPEKQKKITLRDAIDDLLSLESGGHDPDEFWHRAHKHSEHHIRWMKHTPTGQSAFDNVKHFPEVTKNGEKRRIKGFKNTYKRMEWDQPAFTLIAGCTMISSSNTVHPGRPLGNDTYSDARTFTVLEGMRIMGLPDNWNLPKDTSYRKAMYHIGEGVCPRLVEALVKSII